MKQNKSHRGQGMNNFFLLFYSAKPQSQEVRIFIQRNWLHHGACPVCKEALSDILRLMDFPVRLVHSVCHLLNGQGKLPGNIIWRDEGF